jgi:predicted ArsR family transcriptional regulator
MKISYQKELDKIKKILQEKPRGATTKEIAENIGINRNAVGKYLDVLQTAGEVDLEIFGRSKVYYPSKSVPISTMIDYTDEFVIVVSDTMTALEINTPFMKFLELKGKDKIIGKNIKNSPVADIHPDMLENIQKTLKTQNIFENEIEYRRNGTTKPYRFRVKYVPIIFNNGEKGATIIITKSLKK